MGKIQGQNLFFWRINKIDKSLARFIKKKIEKTQMTNIRNTKRDIIIDATDGKRKNIKIL